MIYRQEDMPFTVKDGMVPDIILNPCAFPSRMTLHQLIETLLGKEACVTGEFADATPFTENSTNIAQKLTDRLAENLQLYGFESHGWETMISGTTGEIIKAKIYFGPTYYQRLKHMVDDKMHVREFGQTVALVRQPLEGRAREGGLRFGEMEKDCTTAHGASFFTKERLFYLSDPFKIPVCKRCGMQTARQDVCQVCQTDDVAMVNIPYAAKLLTQETASLCLKMKIRPSET
jgi:DNA-directed RNA polymerase II subunit RPB2